MAITNDEINYLVYRYLVESGYEHSAFAFYSESALHKRSLSKFTLNNNDNSTLSTSSKKRSISNSNSDNNNNNNTTNNNSNNNNNNNNDLLSIGAACIQRGALIELIQKGLYYLEVESSISIEDGNDHKYSNNFNLLPKSDQISIFRRKNAQDAANLVLLNQSTDNSNNTHQSILNNNNDNNDDNKEFAIFDDELNPNSTINNNSISSENKSELKKEDNNDDTINQNQESR